MKTPAPQRAAGRRALKAKGQTLPGTTSFPTPNVAYWHKAVQSAGRVPPGKRPALAAYLKRRAKQLGIPGHVKGTWLDSSPAKAMANDGTAVELAGMWRGLGRGRGWAYVGPKDADTPAGPPAQAIGGMHAAEVSRMARERASQNPPRNEEPSPERRALHDKIVREIRADRRFKNSPGAEKSGRAHRLRGKLLNEMLAKYGRDAVMPAWVQATVGGDAAADAKGLANHKEAVELSAMTRRMPLIRGAADIQMRRSGPGTVSVAHKSSGMKVGTLKAVDNDGQWQATHAPTGANLPTAGSMQGALAGLIAHHNRKAKLPPAQQDGTAVMPGAGRAKTSGYANAQQGTLDFAGALPRSSPAVSASDGPRVTTMSGGKKAGSKSPVKMTMAAQGMSPEVAKIYAKLCKKGMKPAQAMALAKRAAAMHAKSAAKAA